MSQGRPLDDAAQGRAESPDAAARAIGTAAAPIGASPPEIRSFDRRWLHRATWLVGLLVVLRGATFEGWFPRVEIAGDSMAPTLLGEHLRMLCPECQAPFSISAAGAERDEDSLVCPNCGAMKLPRQAGIFLPGRRAWIDRAIYHLRAIRRGEVVALVDPADEGRRAVKRVVGLPGERVRIVDGDLLIDDRRWQKSLDELREMAVLVHDDEHRPTRRSRPLPDRWRIEESGWDAYHHWRCFESPFPRTADAPLLDSDPFNATLSRELHDVPDLLFEATLTLPENSQAAVRIATPREPLAVVFDSVAKQVELRRRGDQAADTPHSSLDWPLVARAPLPASCVGRPTACEVAVCDHRVLVACARRVLLTADESADGPVFRMESTTPWAVACLGVGASFTGRQVLRDIYWLGPVDSPRQWRAPAPLGADEFYLLGDNAPVSIDSRQWPNGGAVHRRHILGRVATSGSGR